MCITYERRHSLARRYFPPTTSKFVSKKLAVNCIDIIIILRHEFQTWYFKIKYRLSFTVKSRITNLIFRLNLSPSSSWKSYTSDQQRRLSYLTWGLLRLNLCVTFTCKSCLFKVLIHMSSHENEQSRICIRHFRILTNEGSHKSRLDKNKFLINVCLQFACFTLLCSTLFPKIMPCQ